MAARLTDKRKKKIIADYVQLGSYNAVSKINGVSATTVKNVVLKSADFVEKCEQKKEENTADSLLLLRCCNQCLSKRLHFWVSLVNRYADIHLFPPFLSVRFIGLRLWYAGIAHYFPIYQITLYIVVE